MVWAALGSAENGATGGVYTPAFGANDSIVASPMAAVGGSYAYAIDPVNGEGVTTTYGWSHNLLGSLGFSPTFLCIPFLYEFAADFDEIVSIVELSDTNGDPVRNLSQNPQEEIGLFDTDADQIGITSGAPYVVAGTTYFMFWYVDLRGGNNTRDILWIWDPVAGDWDTVIDVRGHGDIGTDVDTLTFGTLTGKTLPTVGGPFYVSDMGVCLPNVPPNTTPLASIEVRYLAPDGDGADADFDVGGAPDWNDVKEIPHDGDTSFDAGDAAGEQQSYTVANPGALPVALQVLGVGKQSVVLQPNITQKLYLLESGTRDYDGNVTVAGGYVNLSSVKTYNEVNGNTITEAMINGIEVGSEIVTRTGTSVFRLTQIGVEWMKEGVFALPDDFPPGSLIIPHSPIKHLLVR